MIAFANPAPIMPQTLEPLIAYLRTVPDTPIEYTQHNDCLLHRYLRARGLVGSFGVASDFVGMFGGPERTTPIPKDVSDALVRCVRGTTRTTLHRLEKVASGEWALDDWGWS